MDPQSNKPSEGDDSCYVCYGLHYLHGQMKFNGGKAICFGYERKRKEKVVNLDKIPDNPLPPNDKSLSLGLSHYTGRMHRLGCPPAVTGVQLFVKEPQQDYPPQDYSRQQNSQRPTNPNSSQHDNINTVITNSNTRAPARSMIDLINRSNQFSTLEIMEYTEKFVTVTLPKVGENMIYRVQRAAYAVFDDLPGKVLRSSVVWYDRLHTSSIKVSSKLFKIVKDKFE